MNGCHSGHLRLRSERNLAYPAGAQEGRHQGFHPLVNHPFPKIVWRRPETGDRFEKENGSRVTLACLSLPFRSSQTAYCYTGGQIYAGATQGELPEGQERVPWGTPCRATCLLGGHRRHLRVASIAKRYPAGCGKVNCGNAAREGALGYDLGAPFVNHLHTRNHRGAQCAPKNRLILHCVGAQYAPYGVTCTNRLIRFTLSKIEKGTLKRLI